MADIAIDLLKANDAVLKAEIQAGGQLEDAGSFFVMYTASDVPPDAGTLTPLILVKMGIVTAEVISIPACMMHKEYPVIYSIFTEDNGDKEDDVAARLLDVLENLFYGETFGLSQWADVTSKDYTQTSIPPFSSQHTGSGEMILTHQDTDIRDIF